MVAATAPVDYGNDGLDLQASDSETEAEDYETWVSQEQPTNQNVSSSAGSNNSGGNIKAFPPAAPLAAVTLTGQGEQGEFEALSLFKNLKPDVVGKLIAYWKTSCAKLGVDSMHINPVISALNRAGNDPQATFGAEDDKNSK